LGWQERHAGQRAERRLLVTSRDCAFTHCSRRRGRVKLVSRRTTCCNPLLFRSSSTLCRHCGIRCEAGVPARPCRLRSFPVLRRGIRDRFDLALPFTRNNRLRFTGATLPFLGEGMVRPPTLRPPAKVDGCSMIRVLSTIWNRRARGSRLLRSSTGPPSTRVFVLNPSFEGKTLADRRGRAFVYRTLLPDFDYVKQCPLLEGPLTEHRFDFVPRSILLEGVDTASCGSVVPGWRRRTCVVSLPGHKPVMSHPTPDWVRPQRPKTASTIRVRSRN
jgi:hypothetical protein